MARKLQADEWLFAAALGLALFGVVMVYSASAQLAFREQGSQYFFVKKQALWTLAGLMLMLALARFDYGHLRNRNFVAAFLLVTALALVAVFAFPRINGAHRWIRIAGFSVQPSELAKLALTIWLARFLERRAGEEHSLGRTLLPCLAVTGLFVGLVGAEPDLGTAMMLGALCLVLLFTAGARLWHLGVMGAFALAGVVGAIVVAPWRMRRMLAFVDPWTDAQGTGYQIVQSLIAVGSGGTNGLGFAQGKQKMFFLPLAHSDYIFAVVGEELGLVGAATLVAVFALFLWRGVRAALRAPDRFGLLLGMGLVTGIVVQALFNMSVVLSLVPSKGIPLPFVSYGGTSMLFTLASVGVLLNISQQGVERGRGEQEARGVGDAGTRRHENAEGLSASPRPPVSASPHGWRKV